jgi:hypothetical protein
MAGIESLRLAPEVAAAWKKRVAVRVNSKGVEVARSNRHAVLVAVRTFYLPVPKGLDRQRRVPTRAYVQLWQRRSSSARSRSSIRRGAISLDLCSRHANARNTWSLISTRPACVGSALHSNARDT